MVIAALCLSAALGLDIQSPSSPHSILVFTKSEGFRHDSIPVARRALLDMAIERGWTIAFSEDANVLDRSRLRTYDALVFVSTTGKFLDKRQEGALVDYIHHGGGFVGIHAAADAEYDWPWYGQLVGASFLAHPAQQDAMVTIEDPSDPSMQGLPNPWHRHDEWYDYRVNPRSTVHVLASLDPTSYRGSKMPNDHPITWCHEFEGGRSWYTGMGHTQESYQDPKFLHMIAEGIEWACRKPKR